MPINADFRMHEGEDGTLTVFLTPPTAIGGWDLEYRQMKKGAISGQILKTSVSGFNGVSGVNILDSGLGQLRVNVFGSEMSGQDPGNYPFTISRLTSGSNSLLVEGFLLYLSRIPH